MRVHSTRKIITVLSLVFVILGLTSCRLLMDSISCYDGAYWEDDYCNEFTVTFSSRTRDRKDVDLYFSLDKKSYGDCSVDHTYSLTNSKTFKLTRCLHQGEYVRISWRDSFHTETLDGKD